MKGRIRIKCKVAVPVLVATLLYFLCCSTGSVCVHQEENRVGGPLRWAFRGGYTKAVPAACRLMQSSCCTELEEREEREKWKFCVCFRNWMNLL